MIILQDTFESNLVLKEDNFEILSANDGVALVKETHHTTVINAITSPTSNEKSIIGEIDQLEYDEDFSCLVSEGIFFYFILNEMFVYILDTISK
jgi:hypothetical protein